MTNVTISLPEDILYEARKKALADNTSVNAVVREFLTQYSGRKQALAKYDTLMQRLRHVDAGRKFSREEMNER